MSNHTEPNANRSAVSMYIVSGYKLQNKPPHRHALCSVMSNVVLFAY